MSMANCEICGIRSYYVATKEGLTPLSFCGNHARAAGKGLIEGGFSIEPPGYNDFEAETAEMMRADAFDDAELSRIVDDLDVHFEDYPESLAPEDRMRYITELMRSSPDDCIRTVILPAAMKATGYEHRVKIFLRTALNDGQTKLSITLEPAVRIENNGDRENYERFARVFFSVFDTVIRAAGVED